MPLTITPADLQALSPQLSDAVAQQLIEGTLARAARIAPCILGADFTYAAAAKAIVVDVILRRVEAGSGAIQAEAAGPLSRSFFPQTTRSLFWPAEVAELQALCSQATVEAGGTLGLTPLPEHLFPAVDSPDVFAVAPTVWPNE